MKSLFRLLAPGLILLFSQTAAMAMVSVSPISNTTVRAEQTRNVNVVAVDPDGGSITLTASLPAFGTLNAPTAGTGTVLTTVTLAPLTADVGTHSGSVTATSGEASDTEEFQITVAAADANSPPLVTAPGEKTTTEGMLLEFDVAASDADAEAITSLTAFGLPTGATFTANGTFTSGTFSWTPGLHQAGQYDVIFAATNAQSDSATTHIAVAQSDLGPVAITPIDDVNMAEGDSVQVAVIASDPDEEKIELTASLPDFATLDAPTSSEESDTLQTTITIKPGSGTAGTYSASVTATSGGDTATEPFTITVTGATDSTGSVFDATATLIGKFNKHKKFICFKVKPVDDSFSLLDVSLSSITLAFQGDSISTVRPTHLAFDCDEGEDGDGDDDDGEGDCHECDNDQGDHHGDRDHDRGHGRGHGDRDRNDHHDAVSDGGDCEPDSCAPSHIMACFSMDDILELFGRCSLPESLAVATIQGDLAGGGIFVAMIGGKHVTDKGDHGGDGDKAGGRKGKLAVRIYPNPMNPKAAISFTLNEPSRVRVAVYDLTGRLVKTIQEGEFPAGENTVSWNGATRSGSRAGSGVYFVSVETASAHEVRHITVVK
jgi:flagellar hook capping protein FlgD/putative Ig domain-containing protein